MKGITAMAESRKHKKPPDHGKNRNRCRKKRRPAERILLIAFAGIFWFSAGQLLMIFMEYYRGSAEYGELAEACVRYEEGGDQDGNAGDQPGNFPEIAVDFDALEAVNEDFRAWLVIPALSAEYPVVQGEDMSYYLTHTFERKENSAGAIFMDEGAAEDFSDWNTFLYGHNMKNGSMFGKLKQFIRDEELCRSDPYFYLFTKDRAYRYRIVSYYVTEEGSGTYALPGSAEQAEQYLKKVRAKSSYRCEDALPENAPVVTLSTCYGAAGGIQRFVVHGVQDERMEY